MCLKVPTLFRAHWKLFTMGTDDDRILDFYRAMHFSAKRGIAIACRLSVRLYVCDVGEL